MNSIVTTFIFDCFKVLLTPPLSHWYEENVSKHGIVDPEFPQVVRKYDLGILNEDEFLDYLLSYKTVSKPRADLQKDVDDLCILDHKLVEVINKLKAKGYKIALLSNANNGFFERRAYPSFPGFRELFDEVIVSSTVGLLKPDPKIYNLALEKIKSKPEESIFIDDNPHNIDAAIKLGINGFLYTDVESFIVYLNKSGFILES